MKQIILILLLFITSASYGQNKVVIRGNGSSGGGGTTTPPTVTTSSATSLSLTTSATNEKTYVFGGSSTTVWTLPDRSSSSSYPISVKNRGTASITLQRTGSDLIYMTGSTNSITILPGDAITIQKDDAYWIIY